MRRFLVGLALVITWSSLTGYARKSDPAETEGVVYIASNGAGGNEILVFDRNARGSLSFAHAAACGGLGTGGGLGNPAQIAFTPNGESLVVTERVTNLIAVFAVGGDQDDGNDGVARPAEFYPSADLTPFGFAFDRRGRLYVAEAAGGATDASSVSSYHVMDNAPLDVISRAVPTTETAACWLVMAHTGAGSAPADAALSAGGQFLYTRNGGNGTISVFSVNRDGMLASLSMVGGLPAGANGIAAR